MSEKYTKEEFWKLYKKLPEELKDALFSEETSDNIYEICKRNKILESLDQIVECVGKVLVGVLPLDEFQETLEKELKLKKEVAKKVSQEINRFVFYPVKNNLEELYKIEITPPAQMKVAPPPKVTPPAEEKPVVEEKPPAEEKPAAPVKEDVYREPIE